MKFMKTLPYVLAFLTTTLSFAQQTQYPTNVGINIDFEGLKKVPAGTDDALYDDMITIQKNGEEKAAVQLGIVPVKIRFASNLINPDNGKISVDYLRAAVFRLVYQHKERDYDDTMGWELSGEGPGVELQRFFTDNGIKTVNAIQILRLEAKRIVKFNDAVEMEADIYWGTTVNTSPKADFEVNAKDYNSYTENFCYGKTCKPRDFNARMNASWGGDLSIEVADRIKFIAFFAKSSSNSSLKEGFEESGATFDFKTLMQTKQTRAGLELDVTVYKDPKLIDLILFARYELINYSRNITMKDYYSKPDQYSTMQGGAMIRPINRVEQRTDMITFGIKAVIW